MIILPPNIRIFPVFLAVSLTEKPVNRSIYAYALTQLNVFALSGFIFLDFHKNQGRSLSNSGYKIPKKKAGNYTRAGAPLARKYTNRILESKDGKTSTKIVN